MNATGRDPNAGSGAGTTAASATAGWAPSTSSISCGWMFSPPEMNMPSARPVTVRMPLASRWPQSSGPEPPAGFERRRLDAVRAQEAGEQRLAGHLDLTVADAQAPVRQHVAARAGRQVGAGGGGGHLRGHLGGAVGGQHRDAGRPRTLQERRRRRLPAHLHAAQVPSRSSGSSISCGSCAGTTEIRVASRGQQGQRVIRASFVLAEGSGAGDERRRSGEQAAEQDRQPGHVAQRQRPPASGRQRSSGRLAAEPMALYRWFASVWTTAREVPALPHVNDAASALVRAAIGRRLARGVEDLVSRSACIVRLLTELLVVQSGQSLGWRERRAPSATKPRLHSARLSHPT